MTVSDEIKKLYRAHATYDARRIAKERKKDRYTDCTAR